NTAGGQLVFGSDTYSSWTGIRDWLVANIQQTDTIQQFLAYEKCYVLASRLNSFNNCVSAHEPTSYTNEYPLTANWWNIPNGNCSRAAELILAPGKTTHVPGSPDKTLCVNTTPPPHPIPPGERTRPKGPGAPPARGAPGPDPPTMLRATRYRLVVLGLTLLAALPGGDGLAHDASAWGGLFRTRDGGDTWLPVNPASLVSGGPAL